jgi:hypothetical protein
MLESQTIPQYKNYFSAYELDPGSPEHLTLSPRAVIGPGARFVDFPLRGPHADDAPTEEE